MNKLNPNRNIASKEQWTQLFQSTKLAVTHDSSKAIQEAYLLNLIEERRLNLETIDIFDIQCESDGWIYPVPGGGTRWKAYDSYNNPKYKWVPSKPEGAKLYHSQKIVEEIQISEGICWFVSGESDVWAMHSAGIRNVMSGFGENSVIPDLIEQLSNFGIDELCIVPDLDLTGERWAELIAHRLSGSDIKLVVLQLPDTFGNKGDLGKAWKNFSGEDTNFENWLLNLPHLSLDPDIRSRSNQFSPGGTSSIPEGYRELVAETLGVIAFNSRGFSRKNVICPFHDDHNPSASLHHEKGLYCHTDGEWYLWTVIGEVMGVGNLLEWLKENPKQANSLTIQLATETREALLTERLTTTSRVLDCLYKAGLHPGIIFTVNIAANLCKPFGVSKKTIYSAVSQRTEDGITFFPKVPDSYLHHSKVEKERKKSRPEHLYVLLSQLRY